MAEYGTTAASLTSVTATPGTGFIPQRLTNCKCALPAPTRTMLFSIGRFTEDAGVKRWQSGGDHRRRTDRQLMARVPAGPGGEALWEVGPVGAFVPCRSPAPLGGGAAGIRFAGLPHQRV